MNSKLYFFTRLLFIGLLSLAGLNAKGQIIEGGTRQFYTCAGRTETYVYYGGNSSNTTPDKIYCVVTWTVTGGVIVVDGSEVTTYQTGTNSTTGISQVSVKWTSTGTSGTITATANTCHNGSSTKLIIFQTNPTPLTANPQTINVGAETILTANPQYTFNSILWTSSSGGNLTTTSGLTVKAKPTLTSTYQTKVNFTASLIENSATVKTITCNTLATISVNVITPTISNNTIATSGPLYFFNPTQVDPTPLTGPVATGGTAPITYQWQVSTTSSSDGFTDILGATGLNYDPSLIYYTSHYRRVALSTTANSSTSNVISFIIERTGTSINNPIIVGDLGICAIYGSSLDSQGYGNDFGNQFEDIFYRFNLTTTAKVSLYTCKPDGVANAAYLLDSSGNYVQGGTAGDPCDVGSSVDFILQQGTYYIVTEAVADYQHVLLFSLYVLPNFTASPDVSILAGGSTTLSGSGADTYSWSPSTGLSATTGSSVTASPLVTTTYLVRGRSNNGCEAFKYITVNVSGSTGSTINNPILVDVSGCGYNSDYLNAEGYGNEYGGPSDDIYFKFTLSSSSLIYFGAVSLDYIGGYNTVRLVVINEAGTVVTQKDFSWLDSGDDAGTHYPDPYPLTAQLSAGTYYVITELTYGNGNFYVSIDTPSGLSCRSSLSNENSKNQMVAKSVVYPNPARHILYVNVNPNMPATIQIINKDGIKVKETIISAKAEGVNVSDIPSGLYLIRVIQQDIITNERISIQN